MVPYRNEHRVERRWEEADHSCTSTLVHLVHAVYLYGEIAWFFSDRRFGQHGEGEEPLVGIDRQSVLALQFDLTEEEGVPDSGEGDRAHSLGEKVRVLEGLHA